MPEHRRTVAPTIEPLTEAEAKKHAVIAHSDEDALIRAWITAGREAAEAVLEFGLMTQTWEYRLEQFYDVFGLPMARTIQGTPAITYYDEAGTLQTLATSTYFLDQGARPIAIRLAPEKAWPALHGARSGPRVFVSYVVGWQTPQQVPELIREGIRRFVAHHDLDRVGDATAAAVRASAYALWDLAGPFHVRPPGCE